MTKERRGPLPPLLFLAALLAQWGAHTVWPKTLVLPRAWTVLGAVPIVTGVALMIAAARKFKAVSTEISPFGTPSTFVQSGPFRYSRNPMYLAMLLILFGAAMVWGTLTPFIVPTLFWWLLTVRFIRMEGATMVKAFGADYEQYRRKVRRWL